MNCDAKGEKVFGFGDAILKHAYNVCNNVTNTYNIFFFFMHIHFCLILKMIFSFTVFDKDFSDFTYCL